MIMATTTTQPQDNYQVAQPTARMGLALVRLTIGAMFVWVFFENLGKGLYTPSGYAGLINGYIGKSSSPAIWKSVMALAANHASMAAPLQGVTEISLGVLLALGLFTRPVALVAFAYLASLWVSEWGTAWIWELLVSVIIPTHNEAQAIGRVLADLPRDLVNEVIVVDSQSSDGTQDIAARMGARVISEARRGYGQACLTGLAAASAPDVVVFLDGDYSDRPAELPLLLAPMAEGRADITIGSRLAGTNTRGALGWHARFGNWLDASLITNLYGVRISDLGPFRAARAEVLRAVELEETTYGWAVELVLKGAIRGFRIVEVPVSYHPRIGKSKISGTFRGTLGAAWFILSRIALYYFRRRKAGVPRSA